MADFLKKFKNLIFGKKESKDIANSLTELNKVTSAYVGLLKQEVEEKKEKVNRIRVLVQGSVPKSVLQSSSNLDISMVDVGNIQVTQEGKRSKSKMNWQKELKKD